VEGLFRVVRPPAALLAAQEARGGFERSGPEVRSHSEIVRGWHFTHPLRFGGCLRWRTTIDVQGVEGTLTVWGRHVER
jgi:hypothetical protein